jgi:hypothetical protein
MRRLTGVLIALAMALSLAGSAAAAGTPPFAIDGLRVSPRVVNFGATAVNSCDWPAGYAGCQILDVTLENVGTQPISIAGYSIEGQPGFTLVSGAPADQEGQCFALAQPNGVWVLEPGVSCHISLTFNPPGKGRFTDVLRVFYPDQFTFIAVVPLMGIGR